MRLEENSISHAQTGLPGRRGCLLSNSWGRQLASPSHRQVGSFRPHFSLSHSVKGLVRELITCLTLFPAHRCTGTRRYGPRQKTFSRRHPEWLGHGWHLLNLCISVVVGLYLHRQFPLSRLLFLLLGKWWLKLSINRASNRHKCQWAYAFFLQEK